MIELPVLQPEDDCVQGPPVLPLASERAEGMASVFKALADPTRVQLLAYVASSAEGTVCSCDLPGALGISQPTLSHHLKVLREAGLVTREQRGRWAHFRVVESAVDEACRFLRMAPDE